MAPTTQKALYLPQKFGDYTIGDIPVPKPGKGEVLLKVVATSLNPVDWKIKKYGIFLENFPAILGTDLAGVVEEVGEGVTEWKHGDKVFIQGQWINDFASFQQYALAIGSTLARIPDNTSFEQAATLPVALSAAYTGLYQKAPDGAGITPPTSPATEGIYKGTPLVVLGGASSVGQAVIQLAKISGFSPIITTASLSNKAYLESLGATHVLDRKASAAELKVQLAGITPAPISYVFDSISIEATQAVGLELVATGGQLVTVLPPTVKAVEGKEIRPILGLLRTPNQVDLLETLYHDLISGWLAKGVFKMNAVEVLPNGLNGVIDGLNRMERDEISRLKLVARPQETPSA
ncbi:hypothetical protein D9619_011084 [Psilocybe cf. subviscida]|uniref:Enoyl reductase (ER) domain-containing protein n=1 Tax=Psilocybe cf. subviscida TaxID=2480587 RepID=A0A8H5F5B9_9AGAR|nr:hypothetical protein D9619_011084 [Psilocybe cf. subviscida]